MFMIKRKCERSYREPQGKKCHKINHIHQINPNILKLLILFFNMIHYITVNHQLSKLGHLQFFTTLLINKWNDIILVGRTQDQVPGFNSGFLFIDLFIQGLLYKQMGNVQLQLDQSLSGLTYSTTPIPCDHSFNSNWQQSG